MSTVLLIARLVLSGVFLVAGLAKLADRKGSREAMEGFGLPAALAVPGAVLLPLVELAVGGVLALDRLAWWGGWGAFVLLAAFSAAIAANLARGRTPDCHCFGQLYSAPAGPGALTRNCLLAVLAGLLVWSGPGHTGLTFLQAWEYLGSSGQAVLAGSTIVLVLIAGQGSLLLNLLRQNGRLLVRVENLEAAAEMPGQAAPAPAVAKPAALAPGLPAGVPAPDFALPGLHGETLTLGALCAPGKPVVLVFSDPGCGPCGALLPEVARWQAELAGKLTVAVVSRGTVEANRKKIGGQALTHVLLQTDREVAQSFQCHGTPGAVLIHPDGRVAGPLASGAEAIKALVARMAGGDTAHAPSGAPSAPAPRPRLQAVPVGDPAPAFTLPGLDERPVSLEDERGRAVVLLFWNPGCGFCRKMADDLKAWEDATRLDRPRLLIVSTGTVEANRAMGLRSTLVLDDSFRVGPSYGAAGTPMAVLIDDRGNVASEPVTGGPAVMALLKAPVAGPSAPVAGEFHECVCGRAGHKRGNP